MPRKFVISLCLLNLIIAVALLWLLLPRPSAKGIHRDTGAQGQQLEELTQDQHWDRARNSTSLREAFSYLNKTTDNDKLRDEVENLLDILETNKQLAFENWPYHQALLQVYASRTEAANELAALANIFGIKTAPLTFRNIALTLYVENSLRLEAAGQNYSLIDAAFEETNNLRGLSLKADSFLLSKGIANGARQGQMIERCISILTDANTTEGNQFTAAEILANADYDRSAIPLEIIFKNAKSERVQNACIQLATQNGIENRWIQSIRPTSPQQEQLLIQAPHR